jgi:hypothetical protein
VPSEAVFEDEPGSYREEFLFAVETARALHDPATEWAAFRETLWAHLARVFGVDDPSDWPDGLPHPDDGPGGDAYAVAAWLRDTDVASQRSAGIPRA